MYVYNKEAVFDGAASKYALVAQLDRVFDYESKGPGFESPRAHQR